MRLDRQLAAVAVVALLLGSTAGFALAGGLGEAPTRAADDTDDSTDPRTNATIGGDDPEIDRFDSEDEFAEYLRSSTDGHGGTAVFRSQPRVTDDAVEEEEVADTVDESAPAGGDGDAAGDDGGEAGGDGADGSGDGDRHADTNVQEAALDEPDILKTDGETVYYADRAFHRGGAATHAIDASTPGDPEPIAELPRSGEMLLTDDDLLVQFADDRVYGYDVSEPDDPERVWSVDVEGDLETARLYDGSVYLVVADRVSPDEPCPLAPLGDDGPEVDCSDVHYPSDQNDADTVYTTMRLDPGTGDVADSVSFLGSSYATATYVSENAVYLTYVDSPSEAEMHLEYLRSQDDILNDRTLDRLDRLAGYDLSERATRTEIEAILADWRAGLDDDERRSAERDLRDGWEEYAEENMREFDRTGIVKVDVGGSELAVDAAGAVPGTPLNQWSMDEHDGHLRIATTVDAPSVEWENDLYVLDSDLDVVGEVTGMGVDERVYSVRYEGDKAYVVTFREIDPFHVIDVSDHENPELEGELKLPGYSDYLHPLGDDRILGIGEEDRQVKAVIFDASDPEDPVVEDDEILDDRWTAVSESHTAFLLDERHGVFFLPGSDGGHVYAYEDGLEKRMTVDTGGPALRATYIDDYLYVFGEDELVVVDETEWEEEKRIDL